MLIWGQEITLADIRWIGRPINANPSMAFLQKENVSEFTEMYPDKRHKCAGEINAYEKTIRGYDEEIKTFENLGKGTGQSIPRRNPFLDRPQNTECPIPSKPVYQFRRLNHTLGLTLRRYQLFFLPQP